MSVQNQAGPQVDIYSSSAVWELGPPGGIIWVAVGRWCSCGHHKAHAQLFPLNGSGKESVHRDVMNAAKTWNRELTEYYIDQLEDCGQNRIWNTAPAQDYLSKGTVSR